MALSLMHRPRRGHRCDWSRPCDEKRAGAAPVDSLIMGDWRVKFDGVCSRCGVVLRAGEVAVYERATRSIQCVSCPTPPASGSPEIDAGVAGRSAGNDGPRQLSQALRAQIVTMIAPES